MSNNKRDFFEALGLEGTRKEMLIQMGVGIVIGIALLAVLGIAEWVSDIFMR